MYNVKRLVAGISTVLIFILVITACSQSKTSGSQNLFSKNRLANTTWEYKAVRDYDDDETIVFGENSFRKETIGNSIIITGSYSLSGDVINYDYIFFGTEQDKGSLIGDTLTMFSKNFKQVK